MENGIALAIAYCGSAPTPFEMLERWNLDPWLLCAMAGTTFALVKLTNGRRRVSVCWGMFFLLIAFVSPLCALSSALFSARVVHHIALVACAAPFLAHALPPFPTPRSAPPGPALPLAISAITLWLWHAPPLYSAALESGLLYWVMQVSLLGTAIWFWKSVFASDNVGPPALLSIAAAAGQMGLLGAMLTFAPRSFYPHHALAPFFYGLTPLQDQQLGGLIMWVPAMIPYGLIAAWMARRAWRASWSPTPS